MKKTFNNSNKCSSGGGSNLTKTSTKKGDNKRKIITISLLVILLMLSVGISFAVWNYGFIGSTNTLDTGEVSLELLESNTDIISIGNALPISDETGKTLNETFDFAVTTKAGKDLDIGYSIYLERIYTKCSEVDNPTKETYPSCYDAIISDTDRDKLISYLADDNYWGDGITLEKAAELYNAIISHDKEGIYNFSISLGWSEESAQDEVDWWEEKGYEEYLIFWYQQDTGETITYDYAFNGDNDIGSSNYLKDNQVKIYLEDYEGNVLITPTKITGLGDNYILYNDINTHSKTNTKQTDKFKLRIWVDKDVDASNWDENTKLEYKFKLGVKTPQEKTTATMMTGQSFNSLISIFCNDESYIKTIEFKPNQNVIDTSNAVDGKVLDVSESQDGSIVAWAEGTSPYTLYVATNKDIIYANPDSSKMFNSFYGLTTINANVLNVSKVKNMSHMFSWINLTGLDLSTWDTSKVTNSEYMFCNSGVTSDTLITGTKWTLTNIFECPPLD